MSPAESPPQLPRGMMPSSGPLLRDEEQAMKAAVATIPSNCFRLRAGLKTMSPAQPFPGLVRHPSMAQSGRQHRPRVIIGKLSARYATLEKRHALDIDQCDDTGTARSILNHRARSSHHSSDG